jgi:signal transduction histidine kinase
VACSALAAYFAASDSDPTDLDLNALSGVLATSCAVLALIAGFISGLRWRLVGNASSLRLAAALFVLGALITVTVIVPYVSPTALAASTQARLGVAMSLTVAGLFAIAVVAPPIDTRVTARGRALGVAVIIIVFFAVASVVTAFHALASAYRPPLSGTGDQVLHACSIALWVLLGAIAIARGLRRASWLWTWTGLMLFGFASAAVLAGLAGSNEDLWSTGAYALRLLALLFGLNGVGQELKLAYLDQRARLFDTRLTVAADELRRRAEEAEREERAHEARSALLGIQAGTRRLSEIYDDSAVATRQDLRDALESEIQLLRRLVEGDDSAAEVEEFDVSATILPIVMCHRAAGEVVEVDATRGVRAVGHPSVVAEVVQSLLDNARDHAAGSPVVVRIRHEGVHAVIRVDDRGPGVNAKRLDQIFDRGESTSTAGSGLGLYVARRLLRDEHGEISAEPRLGGGLSFTVTLPAPSLRSRLPRTELVDDLDHAGETGEPDPLDAVGGQQ